MKRRARIAQRILIAWGPGAFAFAVSACGARTQLLVGAAATDAAVLDADVVPPPDAPEASDAADTLPPLDVVPPPDVIPFCTDPSVQLVYVITQKNELLAFEPPSASFRTIGALRCPTANPSATPNSMAVDHTGSAYVNFNDGELFAVSVKDASCRATPYVVETAPFTTFGMGFARESDGSESLYVASNVTDSTLARIDPTTFRLSPVSLIAPAVPSPELTGTGAGQLFAFFNTTTSFDGPSAIAEIDKAKGAVLGRTDLPTVHQGNGWAFAFWGGDFYMFTAPSGTSGSTVTRYRPKDGSVVDVAHWPTVIVGAGVSTCAPG